MRPVNDPGGPGGGDDDVRRAAQLHPPLRRGLEVAGGYGGILLDEQQHQGHTHGAPGAHHGDVLPPQGDAVVAEHLHAGGGGTGGKAAPFHRHQPAQARGGHAVHVLLRAQGLGEAGGGELLGQGPEQQAAVDGVVPVHPL